MLIELISPDIYGVRSKLAASQKKPLFIQAFDEVDNA